MFEPAGSDLQRFEARRPVSSASLLLNCLCPKAVAATCVLVAGLVLAGPASAQKTSSALEAQVEKSAERSFHGPDGKGKDGPMAKVGPKLIELYHRYHWHKSRKEAGKAAGPFEPSQPRMPVTGGRHLEGARAGKPHVTIDAVASGDPSALQDSLEALGLRRSAVAGRVVSGLLPIGALREAAGLSLMNSAAPSMISGGPPPGQIQGKGPEGDGEAGPRKAGPEKKQPERKQIGATTTQGDVALRADRARERFGADGSGTKACVLSDSYDGSDGASTTATDDIESGDLPGPGNPNGFTQPVDVLEDYLGDGVFGPATDEGRAMLQIIHDIAPGAALGFHTAFVGLGGFARGIRELSSASCGVIVDDIFYLNQPMFQDGLVTRAIEEVVGQGAAYFTSAGNGGDVSYARPFSGSGRPASSVGIGSEGELHDFDPGFGTDVRQQVTVAGGRTARIALQWSDPFFRISGEPGADTDLDLYLLDGDRVLASSTRDNIGGDPWEILAYENTGGEAQVLNLAISREEGPPPDRLKYTGALGFPAISIDEYATESPTSYGHFDAEAAISTAASEWFITPRVPARAPVDGVDPPLLSGYSSQGGTPLLFDEGGNRLPSPVRKEKPDITAPSGGNTTFFGADLPDQIDTDDFPNFNGTSAAGPHAAAVAALMLSLRPDLPPSQIEQRFEESATDIQERVPVGGGFIEERTAIPGGEGDDRFSGTGLIRADRAVRSVLSARVAGLEASAEAPGGEPAAPVSLRWQTTFEQSSEAFVVERRPGPLTPEARVSDESWTQIGIVSSNASGGQSSDTLRYEFSGQVPSPGRYAFRLRHRTEGGPVAGRPVGAATEARVPIGGSVSVGGPQPNPSRGNPRVEVVVEESQQVEATLYDALGRRVQTLLDDRLQGETPRIIRPEGRELASGTYFLQIRGEDFSETRKLTVVR